MKHEYLVLVSVLAANLLIFQMPFVLLLPQTYQAIYLACAM